MNETRRVNLNRLIDYVQENYRKLTGGRDYELLQTIADTYPAEEIKQALDYCKEKKTDSLIYLQDALRHKYYLSKPKPNEPSWLNETFEKEPLDEKDIAYFKEHFKQFCDTEEEYQELLKRNGWE